MVFFTLSNFSFDGVSNFENFRIPKSLFRTGGELSLGGFDDSKFQGAVTYIALTRPGYWQYKVESASLGGQKLEGSSGAAVSDTGTSLMAGPREATAKMGQLLKGKYQAHQSKINFSSLKSHFDTGCKSGEGACFRRGQILDTF